MGRRWKICVHHPQLFLLVFGSPCPTHSNALPLIEWTEGFFCGSKYKQTRWGILLELWTQLGPARKLGEVSPKQKGFNRSRVSRSCLSFSLKAHQSKPPAPSPQARRTEGEGKPEREIICNGREQGVGRSICRERSPRAASGRQRGRCRGLEAGVAGFLLGPASDGQPVLQLQERARPQCQGGARTPENMQTHSLITTTARKGKGAFPKSHSKSEAGGAPRPSPSPCQGCFQGIKVVLRSTYY